jgi:hypothetical protein
LPEESRVTLEVFDVQGRLVERRSLGVQPAGQQGTWFDGTDRESGVYLYRLRFADPANGQTRSVVSGKMTLTR